MILSDQIRSYQIRSDQIISDMIRSNQIRYDQIIWSDHMIRSYDMIKSYQIWSDMIRSDPNLQASPWAKGSYVRSKTSILTMSILVNERDIALQKFNSFLIFLLLGRMMARGWHTLKSRSILKFIRQHHEIEGPLRVLEFITPPCLSCLIWDTWRIKYKIHSWFSAFWEVWLVRG